MSHISFDVGGEKLKVHEKNIRHSLTYFDVL